MSVSADVSRGGDFWCVEDRLLAVVLHARLATDVISLNRMNRSRDLPGSQRCMVEISTGACLLSESQGIPILIAAGAAARRETRA